MLVKFNFGLFLDYYLVIILHDITLVQYWMGVLRIIKICTSKKFKYLPILKLRKIGKINKFDIHTHKNSTG